MFCGLLGQISGERLQDHWSSGFCILWENNDEAQLLNNITVDQPLMILLHRQYNPSTY